MIDDYEALIDRLETENKRLKSNLSSAIAIVVVLSVILCVGIYKLAGFYYSSNEPNEAYNLSISQTSNGPEIVCFIKGYNYYHYHGCSHLTRTHEHTTLDDAVSKDMEACAFCVASGNYNSDQNILPDPTPSPTPKPTPKPTPEPIIVYITDTGEKYHEWGCQYLKYSSIPVTLSEARADGYTPCSRCDPPV